ncbi:MAG: hypothetical protein ABI670_03650 [Chloroflexota bacterium]
MNSKTRPLAAIAKLSVEYLKIGEQKLPSVMPLARAFDNQQGTYAVSHEAVRQAFKGHRKERGMRIKIS